MLLSTFEFETNERLAKFCSPSPTNQRVTAVHIFCFGLFLFLLLFFLSYLFIFGVRFVAIMKDITV